MRPARFLRSTLLAGCAAIVMASAAQAAAPGTMALPGSRATALARANDLGAVGSDAVVSGATLWLSRPATREAALLALLAAQQQPGSPMYHHWLTPTEFGQAFGPSTRSVDAAIGWLRAWGLTVDHVSASGLAIEFSGSAARIGAAFSAPLHAFAVRGERLQAFSAEPRIPAELDGVVAGVTGLGGVRPVPLVRPVGPVVRGPDGTWRATNAAANAVPRPGLTTTYQGSQIEDVGPADFATIYDVAALRTGSAPVLGTGQTIALVEDTDILTRDWISFRSVFGLSSYAGTIATSHPGCSDPGRTADEGEAALDMEWAGAVAPNAAVVVASCSDASGGIQGALQGLVDQFPPPPVISVSYGECESELGTAATQAWASLLQQGQAEGISVFVSSGDSGSAGCDQNATIATGGLSVNGLASSPYDIAVGGTDFDDTATNTVANYWNTSNARSGSSAKSYIPEKPWNDTCADPVLASFEGSASTLAFCNTATGENYLATGGAGGGSSVVFGKPAFQSLPVLGMPNDGARDLPDVSLFAANGLWGHALLYCMSDVSEGGSACSFSNGTSAVMNSAGGTSFAAPAMAGILALIDQKKGGRQGNPAGRLYALASNQYNTAHGACISGNGASFPAMCMFHNSTIGGIDQACQSGSANCYTAGYSYGVLSTSASAEADGYSAGSGYDQANGLGSIDVAHLVAGY